MRFDLPPLPESRRFQAAAFIAVFIAVFYGVPNRFPLSAPTPVWNTALDRAIPFLDWTIWIYSSYFVLLFLPLVVARDDRRAARVLVALMANSVLAFAIFLVWPTTTSVQEPSSGGATAILWQVLFFLDRPLNCAPSLHVANAVVCGLSLWREGRWWRGLAPLWVALVVLSTLTTKQHFVVDVVSGAALGAISDWWVSQSWGSSRPVHTRSHLPAGRA